MMKTYTAIILSLAITGSLLTSTFVARAHGLKCLVPAQAQKAINSGKAKRFGVIAHSVSKRLKGTVLNGQLCRRKGRLVYILTVINAKGQTKRVIVDAKKGG